MCQSGDAEESKQKAASRGKDGALRGLEQNQQTHSSPVHAHTRTHEQREAGGMDWLIVVGVRRSDFTAGCWLTRLFAFCTPGSVTERKYRCVCVCELVCYRKHFFCPWLSPGRWAKLSGWGRSFWSSEVWGLINPFQWACSVPSLPVYPHLFLLYLNHRLVLETPTMVVILVVVWCQTSVGLWAAKPGGSWEETSSGSDQD